MILLISNLSFVWFQATPNFFELPTENFAVFFDIIQPEQISVKAKNKNLQIQKPAEKAKRVPRSLGRFRWPEITVFLNNSLLFRGCIFFVRRAGLRFGP